jgi:hypothetical protein
VKSGQRIRAGELLHELMPKIRGMEFAVKATLKNRIQFAADPADRAREEKLQRDFELELTRIWLNLDSLAQRHSALLSRVANGDMLAVDTFIELDVHEAKAIETARSLLQKMRSLTI